MSIIKVALLGFGTVGEGVYRTIQSHQEELRAAIGKNVEVVAILIKNKEKKRAIDSEVLITTDFEDIIGLPDLDVVFEAIVEKEPSFTYLKRALLKGCHIITANKEMFSHHGKELIELAAEQQVSVGFEATVAGGVPIIQTLQQLLKINNVSAIQGILNGTSNFILTEMREKKQTFIEALKLAQQNGYAEADPGNDINGCDAYFKLMVLSGIAFGEQPELSCVKINGITDITIEQIELADKLGLRFKHIASIDRKEDRLHATVIPTLVSKAHPFYHVEGVENAVNVRTDLIGSITLQGPGAGMFPTASAMVEDLVQVLQSPATEVKSRKQKTVVKKDEQTHATSYWLVCKLKKRLSLNSISYSDQLSEEVYAIKASKDQLVKLYEQNADLITYPILGTFELESERKEATLLLTR
jgi:homoserine dehydrogenase